MWRNVYRSYQLCCLIIFYYYFIDYVFCPDMHFDPYFPYPLVSTAALWLLFYQTKPAHSSAWFFTLFLCSFLEQCQCKWNDGSRNLIFVMHLILSVANEIERPDEVNCFFWGDLSSGKETSGHYEETFRSWPRRSLTDSNSTDDQRTRHESKEKRKRKAVSSLWQYILNNVTKHSHYTSSNCVL